MKRSKKTILKTAAASILAASLALTTPVFAEELTDATVQSYEDKLAGIQSKMDEALAELEDIRSDSSDALAELKKYDEVIRYNQEQIKLVEAQLDTIDTQISDAKEKITELEKRIADQQAALENRMVQTYMDDTVDYIELILSSTSLTDFLTKVERVTAILKNDKEIIAELVKSRIALEDERQRLIKAQDTQLLRIADFERVIAEQQALSDAKESYMAELESNEAAWVAVYTANSEAEKQLNAELEAYIAEQQAKKQTAYVGNYSDSSTLGWPIDPGAGYYISSEQGWRTLNGVADNHYGMDIACAAGTDILAANGGTVLVSESHWSYGNYVLIDHGGGLSTLYAHMSECLVSVGESVSAGQLIGHCGLTGYTLGYHLHFEVRENGEVRNPRNYLTLP